MKKMYKINDYLVYKTNVCKVTNIKKNFYKENTYYELCPILDSNLKINVPINNKFIRNVITKEEIEKIINNIKNIELISADNKNIENEYKRLLNTDNYIDLIKIIKTTYSRNQLRKEARRKISDKDEFYFEKAEKLLYSEFSVSLNLSYEETKNYVIDRVNKSLSNK